MYNFVRSKVSFVKNAQTRKKEFCDYHMKNDKMLMYFDKGNRSSTVYFTSKHGAYLWLA